MVRGCCHHEEALRKACIGRKASEHARNQCIHVSSHKSIDQVPPSAEGDLNLRNLLGSASRTSSLTH